MHDNTSSWCENGRPNQFPVRTYSITLGYKYEILNFPEPTSPRVKLHFLRFIAMLSNSFQFVMYSEREQVLSLLIHFIQRDRGFSLYCRKLTPPPAVI